MTVRSEQQTQSGLAREDREWQRTQQRSEPTAPDSTDSVRSSACYRQHALPSSQLLLLELHCSRFLLASLTLALSLLPLNYKRFQSHIDNTTAEFIHGPCPAFACDVLQSVLTVYWSVSTQRRQCALKLYGTKHCTDCTRTDEGGNQCAQDQANSAVGRSHRLVLLTLMRHDGGQSRQHLVAHSHLRHLTHHSLLFGLQTVST